MKYNKGIPPLARRIGDYTRDHVLPYLQRPRLEKKPLSRQLREMIGLMRRYGHVPHHYLTHALYRRDLGADVNAFVPLPLLHRFIAQINPAGAIAKVEDKRRFASLMREAGLPHVPGLAFVRSDGEIHDAAGRDLSFGTLLGRLRAAGVERVFAKPTDGAHGVGHFVCTVNEDGFVIDGRQCMLVELLRTMFADGPFDDYILQPVIGQHHVLQSLNPTSVNTVRLDTFELEGEIHHDGAVLRIGGGGGCVDNWAAGGFVAKVDLRTGAVAATAKSKASHGRHVIRVHPVTGVALEGLKLPFWPEAKQLVAQAARIVQPLRYVGWDVAFTPEGPLLIEGNHPSDVSMLQEGVGGLADTPFGREAVRHTCRGRRPAAPAATRRSAKPNA